ncbi:pentatricopeptide repeat-containing protein [Striga asiatica]|uniref:Pentatricopeptide repeat-containing protein n=1 Tax=Striga asiatica TaxID=4170 RepID=A0A5A7QYJ8_STRAF|nr:pentatricopeptide repeat-containing protein [Striga asiatica]
MITFSRTSSTLRNQLRSVHTFPSAIDPLGSLLSLLHLSTETHSLELTLQAHARAQRLGLAQHPLIAQKLIFSCCQLKRPTDASLVFDSIEVKSTEICNTLLSGYGRNQLFLESSRIFREMCEGSNLPSPNDFSFSIMFKAAADSVEISHGKAVQGRSVKMGLAFDVVVGNSLMSMYGRCGCFRDCQKVFDEMPQRNVSSWNALISGYVKLDLEYGKKDVLFTHRLWDFVKQMQSEGFKLNAFTTSTLLPLCNGKCDEKCDLGRELHSYIIRNGLNTTYTPDSDVHMGCCLIDMYSKNGRVHVARKIFDRLKFKNIFTWTAMINGYVHCGGFDEALFLFRQMQQLHGVGPNKVTLVAVLPASSSLSGLLGVKQIHGFALRKELNLALSLCNALIDTYSKCGSLNYATRVFERECIHKDAISWGSIISGHGLHGQGQNAVILFDKMLGNEIKPDTSVIVGVLSACCKSGLVDQGTRIYDLIVNKYKIKPTVEMCSCMVDMFGKSGELNRALDFIKAMPVEPSPSIWGALLSACVIHGNSEMQNVAYKALIQLEPDNGSNYVSLSNLYASSQKWDVVARVRSAMRDRGLRKVPGCSWISINSSTHSFFVADKSHPCCDSIYEMLDGLVSVMKVMRSSLDLPTCSCPDFVYLMEVS